MAKIRIDLDQLAVALSDHDFEWILDTETGNIIMPDWVRDAEFPDELGLAVDADGEVDDEAADALLDSGRFIDIDPIGSDEGFRWMERFATSQPDPHVRERLLDALDRPRPFRRFRDALRQFPQVRDAWERHEGEKLREAAREWLAYHEIDAELVPAPPPSGTSASPHQTQQ
ncbi:MAG TPA: UPF0158 family protein [Longimicrobium sp.]|nr:UPF0158 family protein [Longimicrobium sp.]